MTPDLIARAKAALEGVADGPWELIGGGEYVTGVGICVAPDNGGVTGPNAEFIAAARTLVPELVAEVERLRADLRHALARADWCEAGMVAAHDDRDEWREHARALERNLGQLNGPETHLGKAVTQ